jgi:FlaA1/EpsC-like NDP-sugar epimerase
VLIGTVATIRALWGQVESLFPGTIPTGCILIDPRECGPAGTAAAFAHGKTSDLPPVLGGLEALVELHARFRFRFALLGLPAGMDHAAARIGTGLTRLGIDFRMVASLADQLTPGASATAGTPRVSGTPARPAVDPATLIGRTHYGLDRKAVGAILTGKRVLITGAGGSIGSELARVAAGFDPESVVLMERAENALFAVDHRLARHFPTVKRRALLHDVADAARTKALLAELRPQVVFHAAAHKHVPLMEEHPGAAVENNLFGTRSIADAAIAARAERFVMISTDKAVNPTSIMGATKRLAEIYVSARGRTAPDTFCSIVRFGNVLGSACSVVPIWTEQIAHGGPVTVTDPRMTRYFMTIPEAATLVAQAAAMTTRKGVAPIYVLDMGEPVRVFDLAIRLIRAHGFEPTVGGQPLPGADLASAQSIPLEVTGIRPGEKLFEQLAYAAENLEPTTHPGINCWAGGPTLAPLRGNADVADALIAAMEPLRNAQDRGATLDAIRRFVPEMRA